MPPTYFKKLQQKIHGLENANRISLDQANELGSQLDYLQQDGLLATSLPTLKKEII